ncbi:hypothetical protein E2986_13417 [Frieseomelitta varia]|uniref:Uncharacterized protein n=1 Tax=Frieseomelitta varia TaxID=561572 RepID=A0A833SF01_9HYME|nr:hypothetical protein E2986_13417 [Frieseomelitta varia]
MYDVMLKEMTIGCEDYPDVKTGFIGEVGSAWPITLLLNKTVYDKNNFCKTGFSFKPIFRYNFKIL